MKRRAWPAVTYQPRHWFDQFSAGVYSSAVIPAIADTPIPDLGVLDDDLAAAARATEHFVRQSPTATLTAHAEAAASSRIEHLSAPAIDVILALREADRGRDAHMIARNIYAVAAASLDRDVTVTGLLHLHDLLGGGDHPDDAGQFRTQVVWIGGFNPLHADYVPAHSDDIPAAINDLCDFCDRDDMPPLVKAAIAHAHFESIHPFSDGNGRVGRALTHVILDRKEDMGISAPIPLSAGLLARHRDYINALVSYRAGDVVPIIREFCQAVVYAVENASGLYAAPVEFRKRAQQVMDRRTRQSDQIIALCSAKGSVTVADLIGGGVPQSTSYAMLSRMTDAGMLRQAARLGAKKVWVSDPVVDALDRFEHAAEIGTTGWMHARTL